MRKENGIEEEQFEEDPYLGMYWSPLGETHLNTEEDHIELNVYQDVYKEGKTPNDYVLVKKDVISKQTIYKDEISSVKQVVNKLGNNRITRVELGLRGGNQIIVQGSYHRLKSMIFNRPKYDKNRSVGFKFY